MKSSITRAYHFSASHRLHVPTLSEEENTRVFGKCNNPFGHGHNYILSVTASGPVDGRSGLIVRRCDLDALVREQVLTVFGHRNLNTDVPCFAATVPTTENLAIAVAAILREHWPAFIANPDVKLTRVHVRETDRNSVELAIPATVQQHRQEINESVIITA